MKFGLSALAASLVLTAAAVALQDPPQAPVSPEATAQHDWLHQLVGEWDVTAEMNMGPGTEPMQVKSTESVERLGDYWIVASGEMQMGPMAMRTRMQLGYDPRTERFVGTWIDTVAPHMWTYDGELDESGKVLTLEALGPDMFGDASEDRLFRDRIEVVSVDRKVLTSAARMDDGTWKEFMRAVYDRRAEAKKK